MSIHLCWEHYALPEIVAVKMNLDYGLVSHIGLEALHLAARTFNEYRGPFVHYARFMIKHAYKMYLRNKTDVWRINDNLIAKYRCVQDKSFGQKPPFDILILRDSLSPEDYQLLEDRFIHNKTLEQIGVPLGLARQGVEYRVRRALRNAREVLQQLRPDIIDESYGDSPRDS
jgi:DNA-directed RNA polymerase specialized sigma subunit